MWKPTRVNLGFVVHLILDDHVEILPVFADGGIARMLYSDVRCEEVSSLSEVGCA